MCGPFNYVDVVLGSMPSAMSSSSCHVDKFGPSSSCVMVALVACAAVALSMAFAYSAVAFATSRVSLTSTTNCLLRFYWANWVIRILVASFCFCAAVLSCSARSGVCHSGGHDSSMEKMASSIVMKGSLV